MSIPFSNGTPPGGPQAGFASNFKSALLALSPTRLYALSNPGSGNTEADLGSDGAPGTWHGSATQGRGLVIGDSNKAALFDGSTSYLDVPTSGLPSGSQSFSMGMVLLPLSPASQQYAAFGDTTVGFHFIALDYSGTQFQLGNASYTRDSANGPLLLVGTYNSASPTELLYIQGNKVVSATDTFTFSYGHAHIGASAKTSPDAFATMAAQYWFMITGTILTQAQIYGLVAAMLGN